MKTLAVSLGLALGLAAPAFAQAPDKPAPAPAADSQPATISDVQYPDLTAPAAPDVLPAATTPEARKIQMLRCSGPPIPRKPLTEADLKRMVTEAVKTTTD